MLTYGLILPYLQRKIEELSEENRHLAQELENRAQANDESERLRRELDTVRQELTVCVALAGWKNSHIVYCCHHQPCTAMGCRFGHELIVTPRCMAPQHRMHCPSSRLRGPGCLRTTSTAWMRRAGTHWRCSMSSATSARGYRERYEVERSHSPQQVHGSSVFSLL